MIKAFREFQSLLLTEKAPPGMEQWVLDHKKENLSIPELYGTAWKVFWSAVKKHKAELEKYVDLENHKILDEKGLVSAINKIKESTVFYSQQQKKEE